MPKRGRGNLLLAGSKLCSLIGLVWLAGLICLFLEVKQASFWLFLLGVVLSAVLLGMLIVQLVREHRRKHPRDGEERGWDVFWDTAAKRPCAAPAYAVC